MPEPLRVLIAEDNPADAELLLRALRQAGFEPEWDLVDNEPAFLDGLKSRPDLVLSDFDMPQFSGLRALALMRERSGEAPFIIISGTIGEETAVEMMKQGAADYLLKDRLSRLGPAVRQALEQTRLRRNERRAAEALARSERRLRELTRQLEQKAAGLVTAQAVAKVGSWDTDLSTLKVSWSEETYRIFETDPARFGQTHESFLRFVHPEDRERVNEAFTESFHQTAPCSIEHRLLLGDGRVKYVEEHWQLVRDESGVPAHAVGTCQDVTQRHLADEALRASLREKQALLKEVHHRVKNNLQVISSLLRLEGGQTKEPAARLVLKEMQGRVLSMALLHEMLYKTGNFASVDLAGYLRQLAVQLFRASNERPEAVALSLDLSPVDVELDQAIPCGLIVTELLTNSLKYAFRDGRSGETRLLVKLVEPGRVLLEVSDTGLGLGADFEARRHTSLGLRLVGDLARQLGGALEIGPGATPAFKVKFSRYDNRRSSEITRPETVL